LRNIWHKTKNFNETEQQQECFWREISKSIEIGTFWADEIKKYKNEPVKRLQIALNNLPLPAAFREAMIAIRAMIRSKRKSKEKYEDELSMLYWLAAIDSFSLGYSENLKEPGFNVLCLVPGEKLKNLEFEYKTLGYKYLKLLKKTDVKWLIENWQEPEDHNTLYELHKELWFHYESLLKVKRRKEEEASFKELEKSFKEIFTSSQKSIEPHAIEKLNHENIEADKIKYVLAVVLLVIFGFCLF
jgi:hypothetical protein